MEVPRGSYKGGWIVGGEDTPGQMSDHRAAMPCASGEWKWGGPSPGIGNCSRRRPSLGHIPSGAERMERAGWSSHPSRPSKLPDREIRALPDPLVTSVHEFGERSKEIPLGR